MKQVLLIIYSYSGSGRRLAGILGTQQNWRLAEIAEARPRSAVLGTMRHRRDFGDGQPR